MRTNIEIDDELLKEAMAATGLATRKATVEAALRLVVSQKRRREALRSTAGIGWDGDLETMRRDVGPPAS
jgi:Arc/MetJ family transcription regulator